MSEPEHFGPYWPDDCGHSIGGFLGTVIETDGPVDVYIFRKGDDKWYSTCFRFGPRPEQYRSGEGNRYISDLPLRYMTPARWLVAGFYAERGIPYNPR